MFIKFTVGMMILALWLFLSFPAPDTIESETVLQKPVVSNPYYVYSE